MKKKIFALLMAAALCLTGCSAKVTEKDADKDVLELLEDCDYDIEELSEAARTVLFQMDMDEFLDMYDAEDDDEFEEYVDYYLEWYGDFGIDSKKDMEKILGAELEDMLIIYSIHSAYCNVTALNDIADTYVAICEDTDADIDDIELSGKIKSKAPSGKAKFNGKKDDLELFIQKCISEDARNGYFYIELDDDGVGEAYWSADKDTINDDSNFDEEYEYDLRDIAEGEPIIAAYDADWQYNGTNVYKAMKKLDRYSSTSEEDFLYRYWYYPVDDVDLLYDEAAEEIGEALDEYMKDSLGKEYVDPNKIEEANRNAKICHTVCSSMLTQLAISNVSFNSDAEFETIEFGPSIDDVIELTWSTANSPDYDISEYLGNQYDGYAYVVFNPRTYAVHYALWSEKPIPDEYKIIEDRYDTEKLDEAAQDGQIIGCCPILSK